MTVHAIASTNIAPRSFMQTDMGNTGARHFGLEEAFVPVDDAADFVLGQIAQATREQTSGRFVTNYQGRESYQW